MNLLKLNKSIIWVILTIIVLLFSYFRLVIIKSENVAYTYDQGRDFLAGARIIVDKNPVFIGPTTGIGGVFHGAWWYYVTALSFLILGANPLNFYYFLFIIHITTLIIWIIYAKKHFGNQLTVLSTLIFASAPYYVGSHTFAGNNILAIPSFTFFCLALMSATNAVKSGLSPKRMSLLALTLGTAAGFVTETEFSFGLFLAPTIVALVLFSKNIRSFLFHKKNIIGFMIGLLIPLLPRLLFELKNGFLQTKVLLGFFTKPKLYNPRSYSEVLVERVGVFRTYIEQSVGSNWLVLIAIFSVLALVIFIILSIAKKDKSTTKLDESLTNRLNEAHSLTILLAGLFIFCLVYRDPFWGNYYEGIQAGFLMLFISVLSSLKLISKKIYNIFLVIFFVLTLVITQERLFATINFKATLSGLKLQKSVVEYIVNKQVDENQRIFCARTFTPPVIPHTYDYLWFYYYRENEIETPRFDYQGGSCWYIIEPEWKGYEFRQIKWKEENIPKNAAPVEGSEKTIGEISIIKYQLSK